MPLARYFLQSQGVDIWAAPTLAPSDGWIAPILYAVVDLAAVHAARRFFDPVGRCSGRISPIPGDIRPRPPGVQDQLIAGN